MSFGDEAHVPNFPNVYDDGRLCISLPENNYFTMTVDVETNADNEVVGITVVEVPHFSVIANVMFAVPITFTSSFFNDSMGINRMTATTVKTLSGSKKIDEDAGFLDRMVAYSKLTVKTVAENMENYSFRKIDNTFWAKSGNNLHIDMVSPESPTTIVQELVAASNITKDAIKIQG